MKKSTLDERKTKAIDFMKQIKFTNLMYFLRI